MRITELLSKESIALGVKVDSKDAAIDYLVNLHDAAGNISDKKTYKEVICRSGADGMVGSCGACTHGHQCCEITFECR